MSTVTLTFDMEDFRMLDIALSQSNAPFRDVNILVNKIFQQYNKQVEETEGETE